MNETSPLEEMAEACEARAISFVNATRERRRNELKAEPLFHYTTPDGLIGIVGDQRLLATESSFANDSEEIVYGRKLVYEVLISSDLPSQLAHDIADLEGRGLFATSVYLASFTQHRDALSQWRAYAHDGLGYAIGFDASWDLQLGPSLVSPTPVIYDRKEQEQAVRNVLEPALEALRAWTPEQSGGKWPQGAWALNNALERLLPLFKTPGFREELEWRMVLAHNNLGRIRPDGFRATRFGVAPFVAFPAVGGEKLPIVEIVTGPKVDGRSGMRAVEQLLRTKGYVAMTEDRPFHNAHRIRDRVQVRASETSSYR